MITTARGGAAIHVSAIAGAKKIAMTTKGSGIVIQTAETAGIRLLIESEVTGTETGVDRLEGGSEIFYYLNLG